METRDKLIVAWKTAKEELAIAKVAESQLRKLVIETLFPTHKEEGTENFELGNGYKVKAVFKQTYSLSADDVVGCLEQMAELDEAGKVYAERLVKFKPELSTSEYKKLPEPYKALIDLILTVKPASPSLELVEPKAK
jgi:hypothetical protein